MDDVLITFVGIDPGLSGAVAVIRGSEANVYDIPTIKKGDGAVKYEIDAAGLGRIIRFGIVNSSKVVAVLERVNSMPGQAAASTFSLGDSFGVCRAVLSLTNLPVTYVTPTVWKRHFKLTKDKEEARALAVKRYPTAELHLKKHIDRAEALLIATYLKETYNAQEI